MRPIERVKAILEGKAIDRPLVSLWKHFPIKDRKHADFVKRTIDFQLQYDWDFVKMSYNGLYSIEDWGSVIKWPEREDEVGVVADYAIKNEMHWKDLQPLSADQGALAREIAFTKEIVKKFKGDVPVIGTVFSPLTTAIKMTGDEIFKHIAHYPESLHHGLTVITETTINFVNEIIKAGVDGVFFATQLATHDRMKPAQYEQFGRKYDLPVLEAVQGKTWFNIFHMHGTQPMFDEMLDYPVEALSWHDRKVAITLKDARQKTDKVLIGGIDEYGILHNAPSEELNAHIQDALAQAGDNRIILGPGCVVPLYVPEERFDLLRKLVNGITAV